MTLQASSAPRHGLCLKGGAELIDATSSDVCEIELLQSALDFLPVSEVRSGGFHLLPSNRVLCFLVRGQVGAATAAVIGVVVVVLVVLFTAIVALGVIIMVVAFSWKDLGGTERSVRARQFLVCKCWGRSGEKHNPEKFVMLADSFIACSHCCSCCYSGPDWM